MGDVEWLAVVAARVPLFWKARTVVDRQVPDVSLADARTARENAKALLSEGRDPSASKQLAKLINATAKDNFQAVAEEYIEKLEQEGWAASKITKIRWLLSFAYPTLGAISVRSIRPIDVLAVLRQVEQRGRRETARRLRSMIGTVIRYAVATARAEIDPTLALQGALTAPIARPRAALVEPAGVGALLRAIDGFDGQPTTQVALQLMAFLFPRPGELRAAEWHEFDLEAGVWAIRASRTKMRRPHKVPLSPQALAVVGALRAIAGAGKLLFPSVRTVLRPISVEHRTASITQHVRRRQSKAAPQTAPNARR